MSGKLCSAAGWDLASFPVAHSMIRCFTLFWRKLLGGNLAQEEAQLAQSPAPIVIGNTISIANGLILQFPDDGWYQVQDNANYQSVCNGLSSCAVPAGSYNFINHTSGQRWDNVAVGAANETHTFVLPDNGWYQVHSFVFPTK
mgnify:CR=1 FL=1